MASSRSQPPTLRKHPVVAVRPHVISGALALAVALLVVLSTVGQVIYYTTGHDWALGFIPLFHVAQENNISTFFAASLLLFSGVMVGLVGWRERLRGSRDARYWFFMTAIFTYLAVDESAMIHERSIEPLRETLGAGGLLYFTWVVPAMILVVLVALALAPFLLRLPRRTLGLFTLAGALFVGGAVGMEMLGGRYVEGNGFGDPIWSTLTTIEETLEMAGVVVFIHAVLLHLSETAGELRFDLRKRDAESEAVGARGAGAGSLGVAARR